MKTEPLDVTDYLASPEQAVALLNTVIASGGELAAIKQAVGVVANALERAGLGAAGPVREGATPPGLSPRGFTSQSCPHGQDASQYKVRHRVVAQKLVSVTLQPWPMSDNAPPKPARCPPPLSRATATRRDARDSACSPTCTASPIR